jgi:uncharacterized protein YbjQ (UPF0145 family)
MSTFDKFLQMLNSPNASTRYDACEQLRIANESSEQIVIALEKSLEDKDPDVADAAMRALKAEIHQQILAKLGRATPKTEAEILNEKEAKTKEEEIKIFANIVMVTTPMLEKHTVKEYLGIVSAEVVLGTGFLSEFGAGLADMLGVRSDKFQSKLKQAKDAAMRELRTRAYELHANAILGVDLDYSVLSNNMLMVVANGTAVRVETSSINERSDL